MPDENGAITDKEMCLNWDRALVEMHTISEMKFYERWCYRLGWFFFRRCTKHIDEVIIQWKDYYKYGLQI